MCGRANADSGSRYGVGGSVEGTGYGLCTYDDLNVGGSCTGCTMAFLAHNTSLETFLVGDVVAVEGVGAVLQGHTAPVLEVRRATRGNVAVLGVVYCRGELYAASGDQPGEDGDSVQPVEGNVAPDDYLLVVTDTRQLVLSLACPQQDAARWQGTFGQILASFRAR